MPTPEEITRHHDATPPPGSPSPWVDGARPRTGIEVVDADPAWPDAYARLAVRIREALGAAVIGLDDLRLYAEAKAGAAAQANAAGEHVMDYNARKEPVIHAIYDRAFRAAGLL